MTLITMLAEAQGGQLFSAVAKSVDLSADQCRSAMAKLCPAIAAAMKAKAESDAGLYDSLLDLLDDNGDASPLDDPEGLTGAEALQDGAAILADVYGSRNAAIVEMRNLAGNVSETSLSKLAAISATAVVAALAQSNRTAMPLTAAQPAAGTAGGGIFSVLINAVIKGAVQAATRQPGPKRRRRSYTAYSTRRRKSSTKRRASSSALEDIFSEILGTKRK